MSVQSDDHKAQSEKVVEDDEEYVIDDPIDHRKTPRCDIHPEREAESKCDECGRNICGKDMTDSGTVEICNKCFLGNAGKAGLGSLYSYLLATIPIAIVIILFLIMS